MITTLLIIAAFLVGVVVGHIMALLRIAADDHLQFLDGEN